MKRLLGCALLTFLSLGCGGGGMPGDAQTPPTTGYNDIEAWLAAGHYKSWKCEPTPNTNRTPSSHGFNRICSNDKLSAHGAGEYPVDSASVKEIYDSEAKAIIGYAVIRHVSPGTTGDTWYWYERISQSASMHTASDVVADGLGSSGRAKSICVGCHQAAGSGDAHPGHDFVYIQVR